MLAPPFNLIQIPIRWVEEWGHGSRSIGKLDISHVVMFPEIKQLYCNDQAARAKCFNSDLIFQ